MANTVKLNGVRPEVIKFHLFLFSLRDTAATWYESLPYGSFDTWQELVEAYLGRFFPPSLTSKRRREIIVFLQGEDESLYIAWERFKRLLKRCPMHGIDLKTQMDIVYHALNDTSKVLLMLHAVEHSNVRVLKNHENFSYGGGTSQGPRHGQNPQQGYQQPPRFLQQQQGGENRNEYQGQRRAQPFEDQMLQFMGDNKKLLNLHERNFAELEASNTNSQIFQKTTNASLKNLETQIGQLALNLQNPTKDAFPSDTKKNPKDCMAVQLRSGKDLKEKTEKYESNKGEEGPEIAETLEGKRKKEQLSREEGSKKKTQNNLPAVPFPQRLQKSKIEEQFARFLKTFQKLEISMPFTEVVTQMPLYAKFLKDILTKKRKIAEEGIVNLTATCSAVIKRGLPKKMKDPGSFTIPCTIGEFYFQKALCDSGASINLMPYSIAKKLSSGGITCHAPVPGPTRLADPNRFSGRETQDWDSLPDFILFFIFKQNQLAPVGMATS